jgi:hypothetical protein
MALPLIGGDFPIYRQSNDFMTKLRGRKFLASIFSGIKLAILALVAIAFQGCLTIPKETIVVSAADQKMVLLRDGLPVSIYPVSTSKFGLGDNPGSCATPIGVLKVKKKIGENAPPGAVFKGRIPTGEVIPVDAPGRDPVVTRIIWLEGIEPRNKNAFKRYIYIHGTPEERNIGKPVSFGCVRMRSRDVIDLFNVVAENTRILITPNPLPNELKHTRKPSVPCPKPTKKCPEKREN